MAEPKRKQVKATIRDPEAARICGLNNISTTKQEQLVTLRQLRDGLQTAIHELERERQQERFVNRAFMVLRFTKATCDAFIGMAETFVGAFLPASEKGAKAVGEFYSVGTTLGDAAGTKMAGGKVNYTKTALDLAKTASGRIKEEDLGHKLLADSMLVKGEVIHAALNNEKEEVTKKAAGYVFDLHVTLAKAGLEHAGRAKTKKAVGFFADTAKKTFEYNEALGKVFDGMIESEEEGDQRYISLKTSLLKQAKRISTQITALEDSLGTSRTSTAAKKKP